MTDDARRRQDAGRDRRYSEDKAKKRWYGWFRTVRWRRHYWGVEITDLVVEFRKVY